MKLELVNETENNKYNLILGAGNQVAFDTLFETPREYEEIKNMLEIKGDTDIQKLKKLYKLCGSKVTTLYWSNWKSAEFSAIEFVEMLNYFPNLKNLKLSSWYEEFIGHVKAESLNLPNLSNLEITECKVYILNLLGKALHKNIIKKLSIVFHADVDASFASFIANQTAIKELDMRGYFRTFKPLKRLQQLEKFYCLIYQNNGQVEPQPIESIKSFIKTQSNLKELNLLNNTDMYTYSFVDNEMFANICALPKLEKLLISVDEISHNKIKNFSNLQSLKDLQLKTHKERSLAVFNKFSVLKMSSLENLVLDLSCFEIPAKIYKGIGRNFGNLKSLKITLGTRHNINFYAKAFPRLESLSIKFGNGNDPMEFSDAFERNDDKVKQTNLKKLNVIFWGSEITNGADFVEMLNIFPNIEAIKFQADFEFSADFFNHFSKNLNKIKALELSTFTVPRSETFPPELVAALKSLRSKVDYIKLSISHTIHIHSRRGDTFTFEPFADELKDVYKTRICGMSRMHTTLCLKLTAGNENIAFLEDDL